MNRWIVILTFLPLALFGEVKNQKNSDKEIEKKLADFLKKFQTVLQTESPELFKGQMAGHATGGGFSVRSEVFNRRPVTITPPSYSAGCGGIDMHMGGISFIRGEEVIDALKGIASSSAAYAFLLGMQTISPQSVSVLNDLQDYATKINMQTINSCELGQQLVGAVWPSNTAARQHICQTLGTEQGLFADYTRSRQDCANLKERPDPIVGSGDSLNGSYNLAWEIIKKDPYLSQQPELAELIMSLTGTIVMENNAPKLYPSLVEDSSFIAGLMYGGDFKAYRCAVDRNGDNILTRTNCTQIHETGTLTLSEENSWYETICNQLTSLQEKIYQDLPLSDQDKDFVLKSHLPILRTIAAMSVYHRGCSPIDIKRLAKFISIEALCNFVLDVLKNVRNTARSLSKAQMYDNNFTDFINNLNHVERMVSRYEERGRGMFEELYSFEKLLDMIEGNIQRNIGL